jgi:hypothetical protein
MTIKLPIRDFARAVVFVRANENSRSTAGASFSRAADTRHIPRLRSQLKCRWRIDPITGTLLAHWWTPPQIGALTPVSTTLSTPDCAAGCRLGLRAALPPRARRPNQGGPIGRRL